uniref:glycosyltransferase family 2 protein n=1 Tax=Sphingomonas sp. TaxID=28214 RepID=UPI003B3B5B0D
LDILIMDNRSVLAETAALLAGWQAQGIARTIAHDEPFNWARANNLAAARGDASLLLFLNNDIEMETPGWDTALRDGLAHRGVGALGALLLYPDRTIQHAGVIFGMGEEGSPVHEGVLHRTDPGGPAARWRHPRLASAVTGAWLAVSRTLFEAVGGFEERLPIAYNDVDFCLRIRAAGAHVVQASHIVAIHRESATRGSVMSSAEHVRDRADWAWMRGRWGAALDLDPAFNPNWARSGQPFDGLRLPPAEAVTRWIAASAAADPWAVGPPADMPFGG